MLFCPLPLCLPSQHAVVYLYIIATHSRTEKAILNSVKSRPHRQMKHPNFYLISLINDSVLPSELTGIISTALNFRIGVQRYIALLNALCSVDICFLLFFRIRKGIYWIECERWMLNKGMQVKIVGIVNFDDLCNGRIIYVKDAARCIWVAPTKIGMSLAWSSVDVRLSKLPFLKSNLCGVTH